MTIRDMGQKSCQGGVGPAGERAPVDTVLVDYLDEFEELAQVTRLKIPAFARALTAAGLSLTSGLAYDGATLRTQINRARAKRRSSLIKTKPASLQWGTHPRRFRRRKIPFAHLRETLVMTVLRGTPPRAKISSILARLERSKPRRVRSLDRDGE